MARIEKSTLWGESEVVNGNIVQFSSLGKEPFFMSPRCSNFAKIPEHKVINHILTFSLTFP